MSISSLISPSGEPSVQDSLWHIALSTNSGQTDFKYVYDIFSGTNQLIRVKIYPDPTNGRGYFDAGNVVRNEITYDWFVPDNAGTDTLFLTQPSVSGQIAVTYQIRVGEDYSGTTYLNLASGNVMAYNWIPTVFNRKQESILKNKIWLSNRPKVAKCKLEDKFLIPYHSTGSTIAYTVNTYGFSNTLLNTASATFSKSSTNAYSQLNIGPNAINNSISNIINDSVNYYTIQQSGGELYTIYLDCDPRYTGINLYFINAWGMFDTAKFGLARRLLMETERKSFQQRDYKFNTTSVSYFDSNNVYNESKVNYGSKSNWNYKLTMNYPTDVEYQWLYELILSPQIYAEIDGDYYPVTIKATNYEYSKYQNNKLKMFEVEIEMNQTRYGFLR
jgi:hypothetical protein